MKERTMFKENDLVRLITIGDEGDIMRVTLDSDADTGVTRCDPGEGFSNADFDTNDLELVTSNQSIQESKPMEPNTPTRTTESIHDDISTMFVQAAQFLENNLDGETVEMEITGCTNSDTIDVSFKVRIRYGAWIESANIFRSAEIALERHKQDKILKPLTISLNREREAA